MHNKLCKMNCVARAGVQRANLRRPAALAPRPCVPLAMPRAVGRPMPSARPYRRVIVRASDDEEEAETESSEGPFDYMEDDDASTRLFLDSADVKSWEKWAETALFFGFTTNPTILRRDGVQCTMPAMRQLARQAFELEVEELQLQAWGDTMAELYHCGLDLYELDPGIVVKIPITFEGLKAARRLIDDDVPVTLTGVYSAHQVVTAVAAGATYAAPYLGRMNDAGKDGMGEITKMQSIISMNTNYDGEMRLLVASIRSADEIATLAAEGCNTFTISPAVAEQLVSDPLTIAAVQAFQRDAEEMGSKRAS